MNHKVLKQASVVVIVIALLFLMVGLVRAEEGEEEGRIGDWVFRPDASLPFFKIDFKPTTVTFNEAGVGIGFSVTRETGSVLDPKLAFYLYPRSRAESGGMDLDAGAEISFLSVRGVHLAAVGIVCPITGGYCALTVGVSAGLTI